MANITIGTEKDESIGESGTVVSVRRIFHQMPVRLQELERNLSKELAKLKSLLVPLFFIHPTIHFTLSNKFISFFATLILVVVTPVLLISILFLSPYLILHFPHQILAEYSGLQLLNH